MSKDNPNAGNTFIKPTEGIWGHDKDSRSVNEIFGIPTKKELQRPLEGRVTKINYFPEVLLELEVEMRKHPDVIFAMGRIDDPDVYVRIGHLAAHLNIALDGTYTHEDFIKLCELLLNKLRERNIINVLS